MQLDGQNILIVGLAKSGIEAAKLAISKGANVSVYDGKTRDNFDQEKLKFSDSLAGAFLGEMPKQLNFDLIIKSPGVPPTIDIITKAKKNNIHVIGEIEFAAKFAKGKIVGITGTNGKTTTTALTTAMLNSAGVNAIACGNIGVPFSSVIREQDGEDLVYILELSSYQLEDYADFPASVGAILNITPDHLARHKTMENYLNAKLNLIHRIETSENVILNADDKRLNQIIGRYPDAAMFSKRELPIGYYLKDNAIYYSQDDKETRIVSTKDLCLKGEHNYENAMAALAICHALGVDFDRVTEGLKAFKGVEHRNEFVVNYQNVAFYNDSKATNPEASVPALKALDAPTVLIAGGMDKGSDYSILVPYLDFVTQIVLIGETKFDIAKVLERFKFTRFLFVDTMEQAVKTAFERADKGGNVLLSPACASWDMYENFEVRGNHFKCSVEKLIEGKL